MQADADSSKEPPNHSCMYAEKILTDLNLRSYK